MVPHELRTFLGPASTVEVWAGESTMLEVTTSCVHGCALDGAAVTVSSREQLLARASLERSGAGRYQVVLPLDAPADAGEHRWIVDISDADEHHDSVDLAVLAWPHSTSLAVWGAPSPIPAGSAFELKLGVKCAAACCLAGRQVVIADADGQPVGEATLADTPLQGTAALYWTTVAVTAPSAVGIAVWSLRFEPGDLPVSHELASATFSFSVAPPAEHRVVLELVGEHSQSVLSMAEVRLGLYVGTADERGIAVFDLPSGVYSLGLRKDGYEAPDLTIDVQSDRVIRVEVPSAMTQAEREHRLANFVDVEWG